MRPFYVSLAAWLATAVAASAQMDLPQELEDGSHITVEEVRANSREAFEAFAGDDGGPISREAFVTADIPSGMVPGEDDRTLLGKLFSVLDANGDCQLTYDEWSSRLERDLSFADANEDGRITVEELADAREEMSFGDAMEMLF